VAKEKLADGRYKKVYEKRPRTPCERLLESADVCEADKAELRQRRSALNPVEVNRRLNGAVALLLDMNRKKLCAGKAPCHGDGQAPAA